jgi:hypothetical protein
MHRNQANIVEIVRFEVSTAVTMMIIIFWEMIIIIVEIAVELYVNQPLVYFSDLRPKMKMR